MSARGVAGLGNAQATLAAPLLAGKPLQRRSTPRRGRALAPSAVSRGQGRPTSSLARALAAEEKVIAAEIDASTLVPSTSSAPERLIPEVADLEDILAERDACGVGFIANLKLPASHSIVAQALTSLGCMEHRGACSADNVSGDGSGVMTQVPWKLLQASAPEFAGIKPEEAGVGMLFLPNDDAAEEEAKATFEGVVASEGRCRVVGWRRVPVDSSIVGRLARATEPRAWQVVLEPVAGAGSLAGDELERELFLLRKLVEKAAKAKGGALAADFYVCTLSCRTITYKGMLQSSALGPYYPDLQNPLFESRFAIYHRRFSTNTTPKWPLAQPMRVLGHNGEINTLQGNLNWVASRQDSLRAPVWEGRERDLLPLCDATASDSANLDRVVELMVRSGADSRLALMALVPEAYRNHPDLVRNYPEVEAFYEYYEGLQEGWDGPALLVFSDGARVGARLDRNGLRPARWWLTADGTVYVASEVGVLGDALTNAANVVRKGRLGPGQMVCADLATGAFQENTEIARAVAATAPYAEWLSSSTRLEDLGASAFLESPLLSAADAVRLQASHGMSAEDAAMVVEAMAAAGVEPTYCMGDDIPLAVLSARPHPLADYFKQRFAQVTNPPIDPLREGLVMSLEMRLGRRGNLLQPGADSYRQVLLKSPILLENELAAIATATGLSVETFSLHFDAGSQSLEQALASLCARAEKTVRAGGGEVLVLSDRQADAGGWDAGRPPVPALLAVGAVHHHLIRAGLRTETSIVAETAQCFSTHHAALLVGYGAHAVCPYLAFETARQWRVSPRTVALVKAGKAPDVSVAKAQANYKKAVEKGLLKILSKMGISLLSCYHGAQIFEAYGLGEDVVEAAFRGSVSRVGGMTLADLSREAAAFWAKGFPAADGAPPPTKLEDYGFIQSRPKGEHHVNNQAMAKLLHKAIGLGGKGAAPQSAYDAYMQHFANSPPSVLRDCLELVPASGRKAISVDEVEPAAAIMARFCTGGMSLGAISRETHETIAVAMNRIGGKSNSGEGGEDPVRWETMTDVDAEGRSSSLPHLRGLKSGDTATSRIKQVASGRFGVTPQFLVNAEQLEIKIAQGAKPGEGGQLPGKKVSPYIAGLRRSKPGVPLISPPPHHDIYSIEDLAQLIYDLHQVAPAAKVSVKLVAQAGIGTVASGVAKANADVIQISGHDGGTGASPVSSIKHCGGPVEMGLAETHQQLVANELRERVVLRVDGGMRSGRDVLVAAALGGDEFGFGTVAMIATGCIMARVCHTNNCPVGVAAQREELRARFPGTPDDVVNYFAFVAEEVRAGLAALGLRSLDELVGRADLLKQRSTPLAKTSNLDLSFLTRFAGECGSSAARIASATHSNGPVLDDDLVADAEIIEAISAEGSASRDLEITNVDRAALGRLAGAVARVHGDSGFAGNIELNLRGSAGQSFGCFLVAGMKVKLVGEANDYVGKGMAGGEISIVPPPGSPFEAREASIVGNTCLYGATGGSLFVCGKGGERFAVRNSMAEAVVEGVGDHCCEYMTGGAVVCLGPAGRNIAAGMTGGLAYFYDADGSLPDKVNGEIVTVQRVCSSAGAAALRKLVGDHVERTGSKLGSEILASWGESLGKFWQLVPPSEANTPEASPDADGASVAATAGVPAAA